MLLCKSIFQDKIGTNQWILIKLSGYSYIYIINIPIEFQFISDFIRKIINNVNISFTFTEVNLHL